MVILLFDWESDRDCYITYAIPVSCDMKDDCIRNYCFTDIRSERNNVYIAGRYCSWKNSMLLLMSPLLFNHTSELCEGFVVNTAH